VEDLKRPARSFLANKRVLEATETFKRPASFFEFIPSKGLMKLYTLLPAE
jgi:hypothetical protein